MGPGSALALLACPGRRERDLLFNFHASTLYSSSPGLTGRSSIPETAVLEPRGRGVLGRPVKPGDDSECVVLALPFPNIASPSRGTIARGLRKHSPSQNRGSRECRVRAAPAVSCARCTKKSAHEHTGSAEALRHSLRNGFTAYAVLSPATNSSCHRRRRIRLIKPVGSTSPPLNLAPATGVGTTRFCRTQPAPFVLRAVLAHGNRPANTPARRRCRVHRIPSRVRDDRDTPLLPGETAQAGRTDLPDGESGIFFARGLDRFLVRRLICPSRLGK